MGTFNNNNVGAKTGFSEALTNAGVLTIQFATDGAVANGTTVGVTAAPWMDTTNYLYGVNGVDALGYRGATVLFVTANHLATINVNSFSMYWGSIDALFGPNADGWDNVLTLSNGDSISGSFLAAAAGLNPAVNGAGNQFNANDNQWFRISDTMAFYGFTAQSSQNAFEFDMAVPEPATWAMMALGFAGLGYAGFRRNGKSKVAIA